MPEAVSNNAVSGVKLNGKQFLYSFSGIGDITSCGNAHLKSYKYDLELDEWTRIANLPDSSSIGVIAAGASTIKDEIYIVGGYHIETDCDEFTSPSLIKFNPETEEYTHLAPVPVPVDDHVQVVYKDSLLLLVTGWSNTTNVANVQIYNPLTNEWKAGTSVSQSSRWRVFGASGSIVGDTLYYVGGASPSCGATVCFPPTKYIRKGYINPTNPYEISWEGYDKENGLGYRMAASTFMGLPIWFGGSDQTYNFDAVDYTEGTIVQPNQSIKYYDPSDRSFIVINDVFPPIMDFRGIVKIEEGDYLLAGGIGNDQEVLSTTIRVKINSITATKNQIQDVELLVSPNPTVDRIYVNQAKVGDLFELIDMKGKLLSKVVYSLTGIDLSTYPNGAYQLCDSNSQRTCTTIIKQ